MTTTDPATHRLSEPPESSAPTRPRPVLLTVVVALVVLVVANLGANVYLDRYPVNPSSLAVSEAWDRLESTGAVDWVIVGDSSCAVGIDPVALTGRIGGTAVNLCTTGDFLAVDDAWMIQRYIELHGPPRGGFVIVHGYDIWARGAATFPHRTVAVLPRVQAASERFAPVIESPVSALTRFVDRNIPLWSESASLRHLVEHPSALFRRSDTGADRYRPLRQRREDLLDLDIDTHRRVVSENSFKMSTLNFESLVTIAQVARSAGARVVIAPAPVVDELAGDRAWQRFESQMRAKVRSVLARSSIEVDLDDPPTFPAAWMESVEHVFDPRARDGFLDDLASRLTT